MHMCQYPCHQTFNVNSSSERTGPLTRWHVRGAGVTWRGTPTPSSARIRECQNVLGYTANELGGNAAGELRGTAGELRGTAGELRSTAGELRGTAGGLRGTAGGLRGTAGS